MREEVNLLTTDIKKEKKLSSFLALSLLILLISVVLAVLALFYLLFLKANLSSISKNEKKVQSDMNVYDSQRVKLLTVAERLSVIKKVASSDKVFTQRLSQIVQNIPQDMTVENLDIQGGKVSIRVSSSSLSSFNTFFATTLLALPQEKKSGVKKITILSFSIDPNGRYAALINIAYSSPLVE